MEYEQFKKLALGDRVTLFTALSLLMQNGSRVIQPEPETALVDACMPTLGGFVAEEKIREIVSVCKQLAGLELNVLLAYIRHTDMGVQIPGADEEGVCPICGGTDLDYGNDTPTDDGGLIDWTCPDCGATGKEGYDKVFDRHYCVVEG